MGNKDINLSDNNAKKRDKMPLWIKLIGAVLLLAVGVVAGMQIKYVSDLDTIQTKALSTVKAVASPFVSLPTASAPEYIGTVGAKEAALKHAKIDEENAQFYTISLEKENGIMLYELEFVSAGMEYDYDVNALTGTIESYKSEQQPSASLSENNSKATAVDAVSSASEKLESASGNLPDLVGETVAKENALNHAGVNEADIRQYSCELELKRLNLVYDIEFKSSGYEYEYLVDAATGEIISSDKDKDPF